jgi:hypothetical protein
MDRDQRCRHAGKELHGADETLGGDERQQHVEPQRDGPGRTHRE